MVATLRGRLGEFPWAWLAIVALVAVLTRSPALIVIAALGFAAWLLVVATGRLALVAVDVDATIEPSRLIAGETATLVVRVTNRKPLPVPWVELVVHLPEGVAPPRREGSVPATVARATFAPRGGERLTLRFALEVSRRGAHVVGPARIRSGDWLGFTQEERLVPLALEIVAHPRRLAVGDTRLASLRPLAEIVHRSGLVPDPLRFRGVRDYRGGDPVKEIHWKASARLRALQTKVYEAATSLDAIFLVNVASYDQYWVQVDPEGTELIVSAAAELVRAAGDAGRQVGLVTNGLDSITHQRPRSALARGPRALTRSLDVLARLGPYAGAAPEAVFLRERGRLAAGATLVAVTPNVRPHLAQALVSLRRSGHRVLAVVKDQPAVAVAARLRAADVSLVVLDPALVAAELARAV